MALPLLSGPPPRKSTETCRKCSKKFNLILNRSRTCGHCGFSYCQEHCTHRALSPRQPDSFSLRGGSGSGSGYEEENCCDFCIPFVRITSLEYERLEILSVKELKAYIVAYNIQVPLGLHEKSEFVNLIFRSRTLNGCLNEIKEDFFREKTVPPAPSEAPPSTNVFTNFFNDLSDPAPSSQSSRRGSSSNTTRPSPSPQSQPNASSSSQRPSAPQPQQQQPRASRPPSQPSNIERTRPRPPPSSSTSQPRPVPPPPNRASPNPRPPPPSARPSSPPPRPSPPPPQTHSQPPPVSATRPPTLTELITLQSQSSSLDSSNSIIPDLSVRVLKSILSTHHVRSDGILEKSELVEKVVRLVREESERLRRMEVEERREAMEVAAAGVSAGRMSGDGEWEAVPEWVLAEGRVAEEERVRRMSGGGEGGGEDATKEKKEVPNASSPAPKPPAAPMAERSGICVICCDRDAIIASVDCGHLALCSECSDMVMAGNRECPLCRTVMRPGPGLLRIYSS